MRTLQVGIIEDEFLARETLKAFLEKHCEKVEVVFMASDLESGVAIIKELRPHAIFLDIEMPGHSGMDIIHLLGDTEPPMIVFTTAYAEYAVDAFGLEAVDYLLKPIDIMKLRRAVDRLRERWKKQPKLANGTVSIPTTNGRKVIEMGNIIYLKADGSYTHVFTENEEHLVSRKLIDMEGLLDPERFVRVHRSFVVNTAHVKQYIRQANSMLLLSNDQKVPVARNSKDRIKRLFQT